MKGLGVFKDWEVYPFYCKCSVNLVLPSLRGLNNESLICEEESLDAWCIPRFVIRGELLLFILQNIYLGY